jgi:hypothetical protein
LIVD